MYIDGTADGASVRFPCSLNIAPPPWYMDFCMCIPTSVYTRGAPLPFKVTETSNIYSAVLFLCETLPISLLAEGAFSNELFESHVKPVSSSLASSSSCSALLSPFFLSKRRKFACHRVTVYRIISYRFRWEKFCGRAKETLFRHPYPSARSKAKARCTCYCSRSLLTFIFACIRCIYTYISCLLEQRPSVSAELFSILACHICLFRICHDVRAVRCSLPVFVLSTRVPARVRVIACTCREDGNADDHLNHSVENVVRTIKMLFWSMLAVFARFGTI